MPKLEAVKNNLASIQDRLAKADERERFSREEIESLLRNTVNDSLGDRVTGQIARLFGELQSQLEAQSKVSSDIAKLVAESHRTISKALQDMDDISESRAKDMADSIGSLPNHTDSLTKLAEMLDSLPKEFPEQREADLTPLEAMLADVLKKLSKEPESVKGDIQEVLKRVNKPKKWVFDVEEDTFDGSIKRVIATEVT